MAALAVLVAGCGGEDPAEPLTRDDVRSVAGALAENLDTDTDRFATATCPDPRRARLKKEPGERFQCTAVGPGGRNAEVTVTLLDDEEGDGVAFRWRGILYRGERRVAVTRGNYRDLP